MGKQWKQCQTLFLGLQKSLQMVTAAMKLKDAYSLVQHPHRPIPIFPAHQPPQHPHFSIHPILPSPNIPATHPHPTPSPRPHGAPARPGVPPHPDAAVNCSREPGQGFMIPPAACSLPAPRALSPAVTASPWPRGAGAVHCFLLRIV